MAIPVTHTIRLIIDDKIRPDPQVYQKGIGSSPKYHVVCSCQWEGWTHDLGRAEWFVSSHRNQQIMRGNAVNIIWPEVSHEVRPSSHEVRPSSHEVTMKPIEADAPAEHESETPASAEEGLEA